MDFWNDVATDRSWKVLINLKQEFDFVLIGGWACYLLTKTLKSKDIDIIADFEAMGKIREKHRIKKNPHLKKYETLIDEISVDIYIPYYSGFPIPPEEIIKNCTSIEGFKMPRPEILLILKQKAEIERHDSVKGQKDRIDMLSLLINAGIDKKIYLGLLRKHRLEGFRKNLIGIIKSANKEFRYLGITNPRKIKLIKKDLLDGL